MDDALFETILLNQLVIMAALYEKAGPELRKQLFDQCAHTKRIMDIAKSTRDEGV